MKKLLSLLLAAALLGALGAPAMAAEESADAQLARVTQAVKQTLGLDTRREPRTASWDTCAPLRLETPIQTVSRKMRTKSNGKKQGGLQGRCRIFRLTAASWRQKILLWCGFPQKRGQGKTCVDR